VTEGIASKANYSPVYSDTQSPAGYEAYKSQRSSKGKNVKVKKKENPNYSASMSFGQGSTVKPAKAKSYKKK
jgi:hypothetical protein